MAAKTLVGKLHLWLGMASGLIIVFLGITGCILAFEREIRFFTDPEQFAPKQHRAYLPPETLRPIAEKALGGRKLNALEYPGEGKSAQASFYDATRYFIVFLDPYDGRLLAVKNMNRDFFRIVLMGHYYLWLPPAIGQPIVASATLIFLVMLITGLILWWPRNKAARKQRFRVKWNARWRRVNHDLHSVLGFYVTWVIIFITVTGLVWGFEWFAGSFYRLTSLGKAMPSYSTAVSDTLLTPRHNSAGADPLWSRHLPTAANESVAVYFPQTKSDPLQVIVNHRPGTYYDTETFYYDQYSGRPLPADGYDMGSFRSATVANKVKRLNYDIHVGAALGITGKIMAFFASLIAASLPVTGFYIWWGRKKKKKIPLVKPVAVRSRQILKSSS